MNVTDQGEPGIDQFYYHLNILVRDNDDPVKWKDEKLIRQQLKFTK